MNQAQQTVRQHRLSVAKPNRRLSTVLRGTYPHAAPQDIAMVAAIPEMDAQSAQSFFSPVSYATLRSDILPRYNQLKDLESAAERLADAVQKGEHIGISGDYDCDGNCSTALMVRFLQSAGVPPNRIEVHIPNREIEGYGVNGQAVEAMRGKQVSLLMTLDNGTLANKPLALAHQLGMDVTVIDHHPNSIGHTLPMGARVVNPRRSDESETIRHDAYGIGDLAAVGVTWLVCRRATEILQARGHYSKNLPAPDPRDWLGLVALATQGDVVNIRRPLNRALMKEGLKVIREGRDPYIAALAKVAQVSSLAQVNEEDISFQLAPIINAPGRLNQSVAWNFLSPANATSTPIDTLIRAIHRQNVDMHQHAHSHYQRLRGTDPAADRYIGAYLDAPVQSPGQPVPSDIRIDAKQYALMLGSRAANQRRKIEEQLVLREARAQAASYIEQHPDCGTLLIAGEGWHEGVIGIVAGRLKEEFNRPTMVASLNPHTGIYKASARSLKTPHDTVDLGNAVRAMCEQEGLMLKAGGHAMAAGASFEKSKLDAIRARLEERLGPAANQARQTQRILLAGVLDYAAAHPATGLAPDEALRWFTQQQESLRPFGEGTVKPRIGLYGMAIRHVHRSRDGRHLFFEIHPPVSFGHPQVIQGAAFHAAGTELETALMQAAQPMQRVPDEHHPLLRYMLTGTVSPSPEGETRGQPAIRFQLDDVLPYQITQGVHGSAVQDALARAMHLRTNDLPGVFAHAQRERGGKVR